MNDLSSKVIVNTQELFDVLEAVLDQDDMEKIIEKVVGLVMEKNQKYQDSWQQYGIFTPLVRIKEKIVRLQSQSTETGEVCFQYDVETIDNDLNDLIGYCALAKLWLKYHTHHIPLPKAK